MTQILVAYMKFKNHKLIQKFDPCMNSMRKRIKKIFTTI